MLPPHAALGNPFSVDPFWNVVVRISTNDYLGVNGIGGKYFVAGTSASTNVLAFGGDLGAEWAIASQVSIAAEYSIGINLYDGYTSWGVSGTRAYLTFYF